MLHLHKVQEQSNALLMRQKQEIRSIDHQRSLKRQLQQIQDESFNDYQVRSLRQVINKKILSGQSNRSDIAIGDLVGDSKESIEQRKLLDLIMVHRMAGLSMFRTQATNPSDQNIGFRFDTSYQGKFHERYYIILKPDPENCTYELYRHTIPHFIPVEDLYAKNELDEFLRIIRSYLNAFVFRREQLNFAAKYHDATIVSSVAFDTASLQLQTPNVSLKFIYQSLLDTMPLTVTLQSPELEETTELKLPEEQFGLVITLEDFIGDCKNLLTR